MTIWYRAAKDKSIKNVFSGDGGLFVGGRWHYQGNKIIYCSQSLALCTLEWLSHNGLSVSGFNYHRFSINIPDQLIKKFTSKELFKNWDATPATDLNKDFTNKHLFSAEKYLGLALPSVLVPEEYNLIINPLHNEFETIINTIEYLGEHKSPTR